MIIDPLSAIIISRKSKAKKKSKIIKFKMIFRRVLSFTSRNIHFTFIDNTKKSVYSVHGGPRPRKGIYKFHTHTITNTQMRDQGILCKV